MNRHAQFIDLIESEAEARGIAPRTLCKYAVGNNRLYQHLIDGNTCTLGVVERFEAFISANPAPALESDAA